MVVSTGFDPVQDNLFRQTRVWLSPEGSHTPGTVVVILLALRVIVVDAIIIIVIEQATLIM